MYKRQVKDSAALDVLKDFEKIAKDGYMLDGTVAVSYTHLDVYKRQEQENSVDGAEDFFAADPVPVAEGETTHSSEET